MTGPALFPAQMPDKTGTLARDNGHVLHWEQSGNADGVPVVFLHGGPGAGVGAVHRRYFDPAAYRIVLFDQRGCGRSTPFGETTANTTQHLVADIEALRAHLGIERWVVFGGSWGSTLSLAYAEKHPAVVTELILRGIFLLRQREIEWFYQDGASRIFPDAWERYLAPIAEDERGDLVAAYYRRLTSEDGATRLEAAKAWSLWEGSTSTFKHNPTMKSAMGRDSFALAFARIECHYFVNKCFLEREEQLLEDVDKIRHIPAVIVQGRYDMVCPMETAWMLHRAWPEADLRIAATAGHSAFEPEILHNLVMATDRFR